MYDKGMEAYLRGEQILKPSDIMGLPWLVAVILLSVLGLVLLCMAYNWWNDG